MSEGLSAGADCSALSISAQAFDRVIIFNKAGCKPSPRAAAISCNDLKSNIGRVSIARPGKSNGAFEPMFQQKTKKAYRFAGCLGSSGQPSMPIALLKPNFSSDWIGPSWPWGAGPRFGNHGRGEYNLSRVDGQREVWACTQS